MKVGDSVRHSIFDWVRGETESAMLHACNAVDGTAKKVLPSLKSNLERFTRLIRDNYSIFGPMGAPNLDLVNTLFPVRVGQGKKRRNADMADLIYAIHRCAHGHGDELPDGFELLPDAAGPSDVTRFAVEKGKVQLSDRVIFGLLGIAVFSPANIDQRAPDGYILSYGGKPLPINEWWGRASDFLAL